MNNINLAGTYNKSASTMSCKRLSGNVDVIPVVIADGITVKDGDRAFLTGKLCSDKEKFWVELDKLMPPPTTLGDLLDRTDTEFSGIIKKVYPVRITKKDKKLQDFLVDTGNAVVKVVSFEPCPDFVVPGINVQIKGRLQSRTFTQKTTYDTIEKTVYEVALKRLEVIKPDGEQNKG